MPRVTPSPRNSVRDRPSRLKLLLRRRRRTLALAACGLVAIMLVGMLTSLSRGSSQGGVLGGMRERLASGTAALGLRVGEIVIEGRANTPEPLLRAALGVSRGDAIFGFSVEAARARIQTLSWVDTATVERRLPATIVVNLIERRPFAIWQNQGKFVLVDRAGEVLANQDVAQFRDLFLIVGPGAPLAAAPLLDALQARPSLQSRIVAAVRVGERRWNLRMNSGADVMLPEGAEIAALDRLMSLQQDHAVLDRPLQAVDLRLPDRLVIRPQPGSDPRATNAASPKKPT
jgi:cell division protein FtsQ